MNNSTPVFTSVWSSQKKSLKIRCQKYSKAETNKQKLKIKIMVFGVTSSVSKQCDCCYFFLIIRFVGLNVCLVVNFPYKCTLTIKVLIDHHYPKHLRAAISILTFLK